MANQAYSRKSSIGLKQFLVEFGEGFSNSMKEKLLELASRSFLTRREVKSRLDLKHVEHLEYECTCGSEDGPYTVKKEYSYAQFEVVDGVLYFSESCFEDEQIAQSPMVSIIYNSLSDEGSVFNDGRNLKRIDDGNVGFVVESILSECPPVSEHYLDIVKGMDSRATAKSQPVPRYKKSI